MGNEGNDILHSTEKKRKRNVKKWRVHVVNEKKIVSEQTSNEARIIFGHKGEEIHLKDSPHQQKEHISASKRILSHFSLDPHLIE